MVHLFSGHLHHRRGRCGSCHTPFTFPLDHSLVCTSEAKLLGHATDSCKVSIKGRRDSIWLQTALALRYFPKLCLRMHEAPRQQSIAEQQQRERTAVVKLGWSTECPRKSTARDGQQESAAAAACRGKGQPLSEAVFWVSTAPGIRPAGLRLCGIRVLGNAPPCPDSTARPWPLLLLPSLWLGSLQGRFGNPARRAVSARLDETLPCQNRNAVGSAA